MIYFSNFQECPFVCIKTKFASQSAAESQVIWVIQLGHLFMGGAYWRFRVINGTYPKIKIRVRMVYSYTHI